MLSFQTGQPMEGSPSTPDQEEAFDEDGNAAVGGSSGGGGTFEDVKPPRFLQKSFLNQDFQLFIFGRFNYGVIVQSDASEVAQREVLDLCQVYSTQNNKWRHRLPLFCT